MSCWDFSFMFAETFRSIMGFNTVLLERHCFWKGIVQNWKYIRCSGDVTHPTLKARPKKGEREWKFCLLQEKNTIMGKQPRIEGGRVIWLICKCLPCLASLLFTNIKFITGVYRYLQALVIGILVICFYEKFSIKVFVCHTFQASSESQ